MSDPGFAGPPEGDDLSNLLFLAKHQMARLRTVQVAKVLAVYPGSSSQQNSGRYLPTTVDVQIMVDQVDANGQRMAHSTIYGLVVGRWHGGGNAILHDPVVGDVGVIHTSDRDISSVVANEGEQSAPGSGRRHDLSDAVYMGGLWTAAPINFIDLRNGNISITTPGTLAHKSQQDTTTRSVEGSITHTAKKDIIDKADEILTHQAGRVLNLNAPILNIS